MPASGHWTRWAGGATRGAHSGGEQSRCVTCPLPESDPSALATAPHPLPVGRTIPSSRLRRSLREMQQRAVKERILQVRCAHPSARAAYYLPLSHRRAWHCRKQRAGSNGTWEPNCLTVLQRQHTRRNGKSWSRRSSQSPAESKGYAASWRLPGASRRRLQRGEGEATTRRAGTQLLPWRLEPCSTSPCSRVLRQNDAGSGSLVGSTHKHNRQRCGQLAFTDGCAEDLEHSPATLTWDSATIAGC